MSKFISYGTFLLPTIKIDIPKMSSKFVIYVYFILFKIGKFY